MADIKRPYSPSWLDHLIRRVSGLNIAYPVFYLILAVLTGVFFLVMAWLSGGLRFGSFHYLAITGGIYTALPLFLYHYLSRIAGQVLEEFSPVLRVGLEKTKELKFRLQNLPAIWGFAVAALGLMFAITDVPARPEAYLMTENSPTYFIAFNIFITAFNGAVMFGLIVQVMRQLWHVFQIHRLPLEINLFDLDAAHAFSKLTARAAISLILLGLLLTTEPTQSLFLISFYVSFAALSLVAFLFPLLGVYQSIRQAKQGALNKVNASIEIMINKINGQVAANEFQDSGEFNTTLAGLVSSKTIIENIPAWPWDIGIFRGFVTSVLLPILLWLVFRGLELVV